MKNNFRSYAWFFLLLALASCSASKKVTYFQSKIDRTGKIVDLPSYRNENIIRFRPDDILGISVNVPGESNIANDYNLPLVPTATSENSTEENVNAGMGRQAFLIDKEGNIDFPVIGLIKASGYTQTEFQVVLKERLREKLIAPTIITVRLLNFNITISGEVAAPGNYKVSGDNINLFQALALAGDMTIQGKRNTITMLRQKQDGGYTRVSLDMSKEEIISSPYFFLQQNDEIYVAPISTKAQNADVSPRLSIITAVGSFAMSLTTFILMLLNTK